MEENERAGPSSRGLVDLNQLLQQHVEGFRVTLGDAVELALEPGPVRPVSVVPNQLRFILDQMLVNAREAMVVAGRVTLATAVETVPQRLAAKGLAIEAGEYVTLTLVDTGRGMTGPTLGHLFEKFFTTKDDHLGLGLSTVHEVMAAWGGLIQVRSQIGAGATFKIYFPAC